MATRAILGGLIRLVHPFPILLDGAASGAIVLLAGGGGGTAVRLGVAMIALQASIGALNDLMDGPTDAGRTDKPIPAGLVAPDLARFVVVGSAALGLLLATPSGPGLLLVAGFGLAVGYAYDLVAKGTAWSWLPFALGLPLLPVFGWYGATGGLPAAFAALVPTAIMAGAGLAIANALADLDHDSTGGVGSIAIRLGTRRAWVIGAVLQSAVAAIALASLWAAGRAVPAFVLAGLSAVLLLGGVALGRAPAADIRERAWELQAVAVALLAVSWLWGFAGPAQAR